MPPGLFGSTTIDCSGCMEKQAPAGRPVDARYAIFRGLSCLGFP
jgi:hypothetical protein